MDLPGTTKERFFSIVVCFSDGIKSDSATMRCPKGTEEVS